MPLSIISQLPTVGTYAPPAGGHVRIKRHKVRSLHKMFVVLAAVARTKRLSSVPGSPALSRGGQRASLRATPTTRTKPKRGHF